MNTNAEPAADVTEPPRGASIGGRIQRIFSGARLLAPLVVLGSALGLALLATVALSAGIGDTRLSLGALAIAVVVACLAFLVGLHRLRGDLIEPLARLEEAVSRVCAGEPGASLSLDGSGVLGTMVSDIDSLNEELSELYEDMDNRVSRHTTRLAQKTASLKILYEVAASINQAHDLEDLLLRYLRVLKEMVNSVAPPCAWNRAWQRCA
ncbi:MAG: hypothetical protein H6953_10825 [Chromatiaceae bacterium]|nr:hypothetical protein [Chromatiaceae bacterium]